MNPPRRPWSAATAAVMMCAACSQSGGGEPDASPIPIDAEVDSPEVDAADPPLAVLIVNEVVAAGDPDDWFEVVNASAQTVVLSDFGFIDSNPIGSLARFPAGVTLAPGGYHRQFVTDADNGFKLGGDEELWVYRIADLRLSDGVDWDEGDSPAAGAYARVPDTTGEFQTLTTQSPGAPNS